MKKKELSVVSFDKEVACGFIDLNDPLYPISLKNHLGKRAPSRIFYRGNLDLLFCSAVGFCGSRHASKKGLETAQDCARQLAQEGYVIVSGFASGVDSMAHYAALSAGGSTIIVLPEGINKFRIKRDLKEVWDWSRVLVISQFAPDDLWQSWKAMQRNSIIVGLSQAMIVIEAGETGGTLEAGKTTLSMKMPLFVAVYAESGHSFGNQILLEIGGYPLRKSRKEGKAKLDKLRSFLSAGPSTLAVEQFTLL